MKTVEEIKDRIEKLEKLVVGFEKQYSVLHQIDMLSSPGEHLQKRINEGNGAVIALKWVLGLQIDKK